MDTGVRPVSTKPFLEPNIKCSMINTFHTRMKHACIHIFPFLHKRTHAYMYIPISMHTHTDTHMFPLTILNKYANYMILYIKANNGH